MLLLIRAFTVIQPMKTGTFHTLRRCFMIRLSWLWPTSVLIRSSREFDECYLLPHEM